MEGDLNRYFVFAIIDLVIEYYFFWVEKENINENLIIKLSFYSSIAVNLLAILIFIHSFIKNKKLDMIASLILLKLIFVISFICQSYVRYYE